MTKFYLKLMLVVAVTIALALSLSTSANIAVAEQPDVKPAAVSLDASLAKAVDFAKELALSAGSPAQSADVEDVEEPVVSPQLPADGYDVTAVMVARDLDGVPDFGGAPSGDIRLSFPRSLVSRGQAVEYTVLQQIGTAHTGACTVAYVVVLGNQVLDFDTSQTNCNANTIRYTSFRASAPSTAGDMVLLGMLVAQDGTQDINFSLFTVR